MIPRNGVEAHRVPEQVRPGGDGQLAGRVRGEPALSQGPGAHETGRTFTETLSISLKGRLGE